MANAGDIIRATDLSNMTGTDALSASATSTLVLTTTMTDIAGTSVTFSTTAANAVVLITVSADVQVTAFTSSGTVVMELWVDGSAQTRQTLFAVLANAARASVSNTYRLVLATAGSHTILLRANKTGGTNTVQVTSPHTGWTGLLIDPA